MRITPLDVRKQEFNKSMRGFDCDEVRAFLNTLADEYETVLIDNKQIRDRVMEQDEKITEYQTMERTLRDTLMTAERVMTETRENANREGDLIVQEAQMKAKGILEECRLRTEELRREIVGLRKEKETYLARFRGLAEAQINFIDTHESDFEDLDKRLVDIVDNVVTSATTREVMPAQAKPEIATAAVAPEVSSTPIGPEVAPTPVAAPVASENDIWRDYNPGQSAPAATTSDETSPVAPSPAQSPAEETASNIADIVSESLTEAGESQDEAEEATEALNIDVISNGHNESEAETKPTGEMATEPLNI